MSDMESYDAYLYALPRYENKIFDVGVGVDCIADVSIDKNGIPTSFSRKSIPKNILQSSFNVYYPAIPLGMPNDTLISCADHFMQTKFRPRTIKTKSNCSEQYDWFRSRYQDVMHKSLFRVCGKSEPMTSFLNGSLPAVDHCLRFKKKRYNIFKNSMNWSSNTSLISDFICDIPKQCLLECIDESLFLDASDYSENNNLKNCLISLSHNERFFVVCSTGETRSDVVIKELVTPQEIELTEKCVFRVEDMALKCLGYRVKEIHEVCESDLLLCVRGDYHCSLLRVHISEATVVIETLTEFHFDQLIHCCAFNPLFPEEAVVVADDRSVTVLHGNSNQAKIHDGLFLETVQWQSCVYGNSQQTVLISSENEVLEYDFRVASTKTVQHLKLPCQYFSRVDKLSPVFEWNPLNHHQYILTSEQCIIFNDKRYLKTPIIKVNHYMKHPPRHMNIISLPNDAAFVAIGSYVDGETVCLQVCNNVTQEDPEASKRKSITVREHLWRLSSATDWMIYQNDWKYSLESIYRRIHQPLIGLETLQFKKTSKCIAYAVIQQSLVGDLFVQRFDYNTGTSEGTANVHKRYNEYVHAIMLKSDIDKKPLQLNEHCKEVCNKWLSKVFEIESIKENQKESPHNYNKIIQCKEKFGHTEDTDSQLRYFEDHVDILNVSGVEHQLSECLDLERCNKITVKDEQNDNACFCSICSGELNQSIRAVKEDKIILTRRSLGLKSSEKTLKLVQDLDKFPNPLSKALLVNWTEDTYTSLDVFAPNIVFNPELNVD